MYIISKLYDKNYRYLIRVKSIEVYEGIEVLYDVYKVNSKSIKVLYFSNMHLIINFNIGNLYLYLQIPA